MQELLSFVVLVQWRKTQNLTIAILVFTTNTKNQVCLRLTVSFSWDLHMLCKMTEEKFLSQNSTRENEREREERVKRQKLSLTYGIPLGKALKLVWVSVLLFIKWELRLNCYLPPDWLPTVLLRYYHHHWFLVNLFYWSITSYSESTQIFGEMLNEFLICMDPGNYHSDQSIDFQPSVDSLVSPLSPYSLQLS